MGRDHVDVLASADCEEAGVTRASFGPRFQLAARSILVRGWEWREDKALALQSVHFKEIFLGTRDQRPVDGSTNTNAQNRLLFRSATSALGSGQGDIEHTVTSGAEHLLVAAIVLANNSHTTVLRQRVNNVVGGGRGQRAIQLVKLLLQSSNVHNTIVSKSCELPGVGSHDNRNEGLEREIVHIDRTLVLGGTVFGAGLPIVREVTIFLGLRRLLRSSCRGSSSDSDLFLDGLLDCFISGLLSRFSARVSEVVGDGRKHLLGALFVGKSGRRRRRFLLNKLAGYNLLGRRLDCSSVHFATNLVNHVANNLGNGLLLLLHQTRGLDAFRFRSVQRVRRDRRRLHLGSDIQFLLHSRAGAPRLGLRGLVTWRRGRQLLKGVHVVEKGFFGGEGSRCLRRRNVRFPRHGLLHRPGTAHERVRDGRLGRRGGSRRL